MKKKIISLVLALVLIAGIFSVAGRDTTVSAKYKDGSEITGKAMKISKKTNYTTDQMISSYNSYAVRALREAIADEKKGKNVMISPASLMFALDMCAMGAKGKTYSQIANLFAKGATKKDLLNFATDYRKALESSGLVSIANSLWINKDNMDLNNVKVSEKYLNLLRKYFTAATSSLSFDDEAKKMINDWISKHTNGMIKEGVDDLSKDSLMMIINAIAFEGKWKKEYEDYQINENGKFTNSEGKEETAKMLSSEEEWYLTSDTAKGFLKYYEGDKYAFMAMLPDDASISINDYVSSLSDDAFEKFYESRKNTAVETKTPAFSFDYNIEMNDMLKRMGMTRAFKGNANFHKMLDAKTITPDTALYIGSVIQKTHIELDEKGTKAAAVTIIDMKCTTTAYEPERVKPQVILDRPFVFAIMDTETGTPVFAGILNTVNP